MASGAADSAILGLEKPSGMDADSEDSERGSIPRKYEVSRGRVLPPIQRYCRVCGGWHPVSRRITHDSAGRRYRSWVMLPLIVPWTNETCYGDHVTF